MNELPELPKEWDWENVAKLGDECDEAAVLIYGAEIAARMRVAGMMLKQMPEIMRSYALSAVQMERERCAKLCDAIYAEEQKEPECYGFAKECAAAIRSPLKEGEQP